MGGVRPAGTSAIPRSEPVTNATVPARAVVPLRQHAGESAHPAIQVETGSEKARSWGRLSGRTRRTFIHPSRAG